VVNFKVIVRVFFEASDSNYKHFRFTYLDIMRILTKTRSILMVQDNSIHT
jgi:hypothetical protein